MLFKNNCYYRKTYFAERKSYMLLINRCAQYVEGGGKGLCLVFFSLKMSISWFFFGFFITDYFNVLEILEISLCTKTLEKDIDEHRRRSPLGNEVSRRVLCLVTNFPWFHTWRWISTETCNPNWTDPSHLFKLFIVQSVISLNSREPPTRQIYCCDLIF